MANGPFIDYRGSVASAVTLGPDSVTPATLCPQSWGLCRIAIGRRDGPAVAVWRREVERDGTPVTGAVRAVGAS